MNISIYLYGLGATVILATLTWLLSLIKRDVSIVDSVWSLMILGGGIAYALGAGSSDGRSFIILGLLLAWAIRLSGYLTWRNWGEPEDRRYRQMRENHSPYFAIKSLGMVFLLQALLAWIISMPLWPALSAGMHSLQWLDVLALIVVVAGLGFEATADWQLARFKADHSNRGKVMDRGLWHYSRHPNYFGEALVWWGFYLFALSAGGWWTLPAPLLMTWLLLKFSGVVMLEKDITERRPAYRRYIQTTNAFIPGPPRRKESTLAGGRTL